MSMGWEKDTPPHISGLHVAHREFNTWQPNSIVEFSRQRMKTILSFFLIPSIKNSYVFKVHVFVNF
jgi:hypothetical protein